MPRRAWGQSTAGDQESFGNPVPFPRMHRASSWPLCARLPPPTSFPAPLRHRSTVRHQPGAKHHAQGPGSAVATARFRRTSITLKLPRATSATDVGSPSTGGSLSNVFSTNVARFRLAASTPARPSGLAEVTMRAGRGFPTRCQFAWSRSARPLLTETAGTMRRATPSC